MEVIKEAETEVKETVITEDFFNKNFQMLTDKHGMCLLKNSTDFEKNKPFNIFRNKMCSNSNINV